MKTLASLLNSVSPRREKDKLKKKKKTKSRPRRYEREGWSAGAAIQPDTEPYTPDEDGDEA